uniref:interferon lambda receptor 1 isoform X1 n=2 Tax=Jaculus jaculus TaxID=51337 RepID=UPI001E1B1612|nr:interferon lambda receptor 1 isoform X1 [Jaculus jaculus]
MSSGAGRWASLLLCLLQAAPGRPQLASPRNVTLFSQNFSVYLTWLPGLGSPPDVTYFVAYQGFPSSQPWRKVKKCAGTRSLVCPLMCLKKQDLYNKFKGRVQAAWGGIRSPPVESKYLNYLFEVEPAPPALVLTRTEKILRVNATYQLPPCMRLMDLKYEVKFWKEGTGSQTLFPATPHGQPVQIPLQPATSGRHCLSARTIYTLTTPKYSHFSEPSCIFLGVPGANWPVLVLPSSLLPVLLAVATGGVIWKCLKENPWFQRVKMPRVLDFSGFRQPVTTFQPSGPQYPDALFLCPQKEPTIRVRPPPQVRDPATLQGGSEKDSTEDELEDTEDSDSLQPYLEPPPFLRKELQVAQHSEADESGVDSGGASWTPLDKSEGSSAWDASDRSWPSAVVSLPWDEAESSSYLIKKRLDQRPDWDRQQEPLPCLDFSENLGALEEPLKEVPSWWAMWGASCPQQDLVTEEPLVSLQTLTFCWDSSPKEGEEEEEEGDWESEPEDSSGGSWKAAGLHRAEAMGGTLGHYMAR